jgi:hypothetical protein
VYQLSGVIASQAAKNWAKMQIYEALFAILLILIVAAFSYLMFLNPLSNFSAAGLLPATCNSNVVNSIFGISVCDISTFNFASQALYDELYYVSYVGALSPGATAKLSVPLVSGVSISTSLDSIFPKDIEDLLAVASSLIVTMLLINQVQLILLSGSLFFLPFLLSIGIVAWIFGFSRRFGGAMIALGLGIGLIYPILTSLTYGFMDVQLIHLFLLSSSGASGSVVSTLTLAGMDAIFTTQFATFGASAIPVIFGVGAFPYTAPFFLELGYLVAGLTFIPFINIVILDVFVIDMSSAIGVRISFMTLLNGLV